LQWIPHLKQALPLSGHSIVFLTYLIMLQNIILHPKQQRATIQNLSSTKSILLVNVFSNQPLQGAAPKGLRFTLKDDCNRYDCFSFQHPGELYFNCFEILSQLDGRDTSILLDELTISCEGIEFSASAEIHISLKIS
jgi:hypothetical protein